MDNEQRTKEDGPAPNAGEVGADTKYRESYPDKAYKLALLGATNEFMAEFFNIDEATLYRWKNDHAEFCEAISRGKADADMEIAESLYKSAKGFQLTEEHAFKVKAYDENGKQVEKVETVTLTKQMPPDYRSISFWLRNRQPHVWRDKIDVEHGGSVGVFEAQFGDKDLGDDDYKAGD